MRGFSAAVSLLVVGLWAAAVQADPQAGPQTVTQTAQPQVKRPQAEAPRAKPAKTAKAKNKRRKARRKKPKMAYWRAQLQKAAASGRRGRYAKARGQAEALLAVMRLDPTVGEGAEVHVLCLLGTIQLYQDDFVGGEARLRSVLAYYEAREAALLDLSDCDLVVLSACDTAKAAYQRGEGMLGLVRGFRVAGARHVIASLWKVEDRATRMLMAFFYTRYFDAARPCTPAQALAEAQASLRSYEQEVEVVDAQRSAMLGREVRVRVRVKPYAAPRYWAAFVCYGSGSAR